MSYQPDQQTLGAGTTLTVPNTGSAPFLSDLVVGTADLGMTLSMGIGEATVSSVPAGWTEVPLEKSPNVGNRYSVRPNTVDADNVTLLDTLEVNLEDRYYQAGLHVYLAGMEIHESMTLDGTDVSTYMQVYPASLVGDNGYVWFIPPVATNPLGPHILQLERKTGAVTRPFQGGGGFQEGSALELVCGRWYIPLGEPFLFVLGTQSNGGRGWGRLKYADPAVDPPVFTDFSVLFATSATFMAAGVMSMSQSDATYVVSDDGEVCRMNNSGSFSSGQFSNFESLVGCSSFWNTNGGGGYVLFKASDGYKYLSDSSIPGQEDVVTTLPGDDLLYGATASASKSKFYVVVAKSNGTTVLRDYTFNGIDVDIGTDTRLPDGFKPRYITLASVDASALYTLVEGETTGTFVLGMLHLQAGGDYAYYPLQDESVQWHVETNRFWQGGQADFTTSIRLPPQAGLLGATRNIVSSLVTLRHDEGYYRPRPALEAPPQQSEDFAQDHLYVPFKSFNVQGKVSAALLKVTEGALSLQGGVTGWTVEDASVPGTLLVTSEAEAPDTSQLLQGVRLLWDESDVSQAITATFGGAQQHDVSRGGITTLTPATCLASEDLGMCFMVPKTSDDLNSGLHLVNLNSFASSTFADVSGFTAASALEFPLARDASTFVVYGTIADTPCLASVVVDPDDGTTATSLQNNPAGADGWTDFSYAASGTHMAWVSTFGANIGATTVIDTSDLSVHTGTLDATVTLVVGVVGRGTGSDPVTLWQGGDPSGWHLTVMDDTLTTSDVPAPPSPGVEGSLALVNGHLWMQCTSGDLVSLNVQTSPLPEAWTVVASLDAGVTLRHVMGGPVADSALTWVQASDGGTWSYMLLDWGSGVPWRVPLSSAQVSPAYVSTTGCAPGFGLTMVGETGEALLPDGVTTASSLFRVQAEHVTPTPSPTLSPPPTDVPKGGGDGMVLPLWAILVIAFVLLVGLAVGAFFIWKKYRKKKR